MDQIAEIKYMDSDNISDIDDDWTPGEIPLLSELVSDDDSPMETRDGNESDEVIDILDDEDDAEKDKSDGSKKKLKYARHTLYDRKKLVTAALRNKEIWEEENSKRKSVYNEKTRKWVTPPMKWGYLSRTIREEYPYLKDVRAGNPDLKSKIKVLQRAMKLFTNKNASISNNVHAFKTKFRTYGAGRHFKLPPVRYAAFDWFVDHRHLLKCRLSRPVFKTVLKEIQENYIKQEVREGRDAPSEVKFSNRWLKTWCKQFGISLKKPNKRYALSYDERKIRIIDMVKNVWTARLYFLKKFGREPVIWGGDQMPLHRNEQTSVKTMSWTNADCFVKENYMHSRERCTVYTTVSSDASKPAPKPSFLFKGKGKNVKVKPPAGVNVQWSDSGSFRVNNMLDLIQTVPAYQNMWNKNDCYIYLLDDYSAHLVDDVKKALRGRGWIQIVFGGGITGDLQVNDTHLHHRLKTGYRLREETFYRNALKNDPNKIPSMNRDDQMRILTESYDDLIQSGTFDPVMAYKQNFLTVKFDGSEDHLVSMKLMDLVGEELIEFRKELLASGPASNLLALIKSITPPKGVKFKAPADTSEQLEDEGQELLSNDFTLEPENDEPDASDDIDFDLVIDEDEEIPQVMVTTDDSESSSSTTRVHLKSPAAPEPTTSKPIDPKFKKDVDILKEFLKLVQEKRSDAKYCMSFLNSTETTAKKVLRDMYKS